MSRLVIDASIALSWLLPDEASDGSLAVRKELLSAESVWVAAHWHLEVCNSPCHHGAACVNRSGRQTGMIFSTV